MKEQRAGSGTPISVIVVVSGRHDPLESLHGAYRDGLAALAQPLEFVYVLDGPCPEGRQALDRLQAQGEPVRIIQLNRAFGEAAALSAAFRHVRGEVIVTLPAFHQVEATELPRLVESLEGADLVVARRSPRVDSRLNRVQTAVFGALVRALTRTPFRDLGCNARALRRRVAEEIDLYGDQHRFLPLLAVNHGFRVLEIAMRQSARDRFRRIAAPGTCVRRMLDLLTVFFITKFTRRPMRFYGLIGSATAGGGGVYMAYLVFQRLVTEIPLADRPALLLAALLVVLGVQIFSMGLIGELIIYANARNMDEYAIEAVIERGEPAPDWVAAQRARGDSATPVPLRTVTGVH